MAGWFARRVVRAQLRDDDIVSSTGASVVRYSEYRGEGRCGRTFWIVASVMQLVLFVGLPLVLVWSVWGRSDLDRADPARVGLILVVALASWWCALIWQSSYGRWCEASRLQHASTSRTTIRDVLTRAATGLPFSGTDGKSLRAAG